MSMVSEVAQALAAPGEAIAALEDCAPTQPGVYAVYGGARAWFQLGLGEPPDDRPLYVGKSESNLAGRDLRTHFADGRTGQSTLRRSIGALLAESLGLRAQPRNPARPERYTSFGLSREGDATLTAWMREHLRLACWSLSRSNIRLADLERALMLRWLPPLNLSGCTTPWTAFVKEARARMAKEARAWRPS